jgi:hypothetical protein
VVYLNVGCNQRKTQSGLTKMLQEKENLTFHYLLGERLVGQHIFTVTKLNRYGNARYYYFSLHFGNCLPLHSSKQKSE